MNELAPHRARLHSLTRAFTDRARPHAKELTGFEVYFDLRGTEFLLLLVRLSSIEGLSARRVLEIGCGAGFNLRLWAELGELVVGTDLPDEIEKARKVIDLLPPPDDCEVRLMADKGEDLAAVEGTFDLILTEYVLEHVDDLGAVLNRIRERLTPDGHAIHVLPNITDRHDWYVSYRMQTTLLTRLRDSFTSRGFRQTMRSPFEFTTPHEIQFGDFATEHAHYRLESWAQKVIEADFEIVDFFSTRDVNTVLVTRAI